MSSMNKMIVNEVGEKYKMENVHNLNVLKIQEEKETGVCDISSAENFFKLL